MYKIFFKEGVILLKADNEEFTVPWEPDLSYHFSNQENLKKIIRNLKGSSKIRVILVKHSDVEPLFKAFSELFKVREAAGGVVQNPDNQFLVFRRHNIWDLPKGHVESGESYENAALREVSEECGITGLTIEHFLFRTFHHYILNNEDILKVTFWYKMRYNGSELPTPQTEESITEIQWASKYFIEEIKKDTYPSLIDIFNAVLYENF